MKIFETKNELRSELKSLSAAGRRIGLVPTMGALHQGHLALIGQARETADVVVCSIFVNPTQFNDPNDLQKYPRPIGRDKELLQAADCDILFLPTVSEMYSPGEDPWHINLGDLDQIWEGAHRPGHFQGVSQIVYKLFDAIRPDIAFFGQKDYQQILVIRRMLELMALPIHLQIVPTVRDAQGLALSSRNSRLSSEGLTKAHALSRALYHICSRAYQAPVPVLLREATAIIQQEPEIELEYLSICDSRTLHTTDVIRQGQTQVVLLAAWIEGVRLIDNMLIDGQA